MKQRDLMRKLNHELGDKESALVRGYAEAEHKGIIMRRSNAFDLSAEQYGKALYRDGIRKGWIFEEPTK